MLAGGLTIQPFTGGLAVMSILSRLSTRSDQAKPVDRAPSMPTAPATSAPAPTRNPPVADSPLPAGPPRALRGARGRLLPGQSLNPGGRPKGVEARMIAALEARGVAGESFIEWCEAIVRGDVDVSHQTRLELGWKMHERAYGRALERSQSVNLAVGVGAPAPVSVRRLSGQALRELLDLSKDLTHTPAHLPAGDVIEGEILPSAGQLAAKADKAP